MREGPEKGGAIAGLVIDRESLMDQGRREECSNARIVVTEFRNNHYFHSAQSPLNEPVYRNHDKRAFL